MGLRPLIARLSLGHSRLPTTRWADRFKNVSGTAAPLLLPGSFPQRCSLSAQVVAQGGIYIALRAFTGVVDDNGFHQSKGEMGWGAMKERERERRGCNAVMSVGVESKKRQQTLSRASSASCFPPLGFHLEEWAFIHHRSCAVLVCV